MAISFRNIEDRSIWAFARVYCPNHASDGRILWDELAGIMSWWNMPCCIGGDFNVTQSGATSTEPMLSDPFPPVIIFTLHFSAPYL